MFPKWITKRQPTYNKDKSVDISLLQPPSTNKSRSFGYNQYHSVQHFKKQNNDNENEYFDDNKAVKK